MGTKTNRLLGCSMLRLGLGLLMIMVVTLQRWEAPTWVMAFFSALDMTNYCGLVSGAFGGCRCCCEGGSS